MTKYKGKIQPNDTAYVQANLVWARSIYSGGSCDVHAHDSQKLFFNVYLAETMHRFCRLFTWQVEEAM